MTSGPLKGLTVLDFGQGVAGPYCGQLLGDYGADVIKIEPPRGDWARQMGIRDAHGNSGTFVSVNRNKRGVVLDLAHDEAREIVRQLVRRSDIVVESFRHGVMDRLQLGYDVLAALNPALVYVAVTGFGTSGPNTDLPAGDSTMQAYGGLMSIVGERDGSPLRVGNVVSDMIAGTNAFSGALLALLQRMSTGKGSRVDVSLLDSIVAFQAPPLTEFLLTGRPPSRSGNEHPLIAPSGVARASDSSFVYTVLGHQWERFCRAVGLEKLHDDPCFSTAENRLHNRQELNECLAGEFARRSTADWLDRFREAGILCAPIQDYPALVRDPQVVHNGLVRTLAEDGRPAVPTIRNAVRIDDMPEEASPPPKLGQHTAEILGSELGLDPQAIVELAEKGAIRLDGTSEGRRAE